MVKRPKSPEPVEDSKFLAVVHPFPLNANMDVPNDFKEFMYWLASIAGKDYALGVYYKPSARGMVIAEVSKLYQDFDKLLGEHRWVEFLHKVSTEERERKTKVYYSTYSNGRALQKDGWKYILADDALFTEFRPINRKIKHPYPTPRWCEVPYEDPTNKVICRPLPVSSKAPPPKPVAPIPGSSTWISQKAGGSGPSSPSQEQLKSGVSKKGKGKVSTNLGSWKTPITSPTTRKSPTTSTPTSPNVPNLPPKSAWERPLGPTAPSISTARSVSPASATAGTEITAVSPTSPSYASRFASLPTSPPPGLAPPGLPPPRSTNRAGSSSVAVLQNRFVAVSVADSGFDSDNSEDFDFPNMSAVTPQVDSFQSSSAAQVFSSNAPRAGKGGNILPVPLSASTKDRNKKEDHPGNFWSTVPQNAGRTFRKVVEEDEMCPVHGIVCSKGICSVMKKRKWERERNSKREERERDKEARRRVKAAEEGGGEPGPVEENGSDHTPGESEGENVKSRTGSHASRVDKESDGGFTVVGKGRSGDWSNRKARNAKQKGVIPDDGSAVLSSARPTYGSVSSEALKTAPPSISSYSAATATVSSATERQVWTNTGSTSVSSMSGSAWQGTNTKITGINGKNNKSNSVRGSVDGKSSGKDGKEKNGTTSGGKMKNTVAKTWDEMVDGEDASELGPVMDL